ncbi:FlgO family outer membrane protein [Arcobacter sp. s6]|jgi:TolB-like protein|uniref:FlgO family outer membrane protein n=1 Tax=Arcobacter sp. s6 TaxID=3230363 RepID=UPI00349FFB98
MIFSFLRVMKLVIISVLFSILFTSCAYKNPINGNTNFHSLVSKLVDESSNKIKKNLQANDVVLVSDFVNLDKLKNKSQLGFLLSSMLKDRLVSLDIIVREVEFGKEFEFGKSGFNLLTREKEKILSDKVNSRYAVVGTYSITSRSLNVFIKLIDINTGNILSSSYERTDIDDEILGLEGNREGQVPKKTPTPRPFLVL